MLQLADDNVRPQGHPSKALDEQRAPGTAAYRKYAVDSIVIFFYWM